MSSIDEYAETLRRFGIDPEDDPVYQFRLLPKEEQRRLSKEGIYPAQPRVCYSNDVCTVYRLRYEDDRPDCYTIAAYEVWVSGMYDSCETAIAAALFDQSHLQQIAHVWRTDGRNRLATMDDLTTICVFDEDDDNE